MSQLEQALTLARSASLRQIEASCLHYLGNGSLDLSDYTEAKTYYEQARHIHREMGNRLGEC